MKRVGGREREPSKSTKSTQSLESMTGYGEVRTTLDRKDVLVCRARSLNHRFLDLKIRLPRADLASLEMAIRKRVSAVFGRGAIELVITASAPSGAPGSAVNAEMASAYYQAFRAVARRLKVRPPGLEAVLRLPGVVASSTDNPALTSATEETVLGKLVEPALQALKRSRVAEGGRLAAHLLRLFDEVEGHVEAIRALEAPEKAKARESAAARATETLRWLRAAVAEGESGNAAATSAFAAIESFKSRLREEAAFWVERRDFEEERVRLEIHLDAFRDLLRKPAAEPPGRRLEFLLQEILRETNTLGSKAQSPAISARTVEIKAALERIKEQLANVE